jgi:hypothetical protein
LRVAVMINESIDAQLKRVQSWFEPRDAAAEG